MKRVAFLAVVIGFVLSTHSVDAQSTGIQLLNECQAAATKSSSEITSAELPEAMHCLGYLSGVEYMFWYWEAYNNGLNGHTAPPVCIPNGVTALELAKVMVKYLNDHPNKLHDDDAILVILAFKDAYPCKK